jgi:HrpA-like RNA helicase
VYRLYTQENYNDFDENPTPEMCRVPLVDFCLSIRALDPVADKSLLSWLQSTVSRPQTVFINNAVHTLQQLGGIDGKERLTKLGWCMDKLSISSKFAKSILLSCFLNCLDPVLTIAAILTSR